MTKIEQELMAIETMIYIIRGQRVMLDSDLAKLYGVETKQLNRQVQRNLKRFPVDFMFQLTENEEENLRCQFGTSKSQFKDRQLPGHHLIKRCTFKSSIPLKPRKSRRKSNSLYISIIISRYKTITLFSYFNDKWFKI